MASTSKARQEDGEDDQEEEFEHFKDFTIASAWERFISEIEAVCRQWLATGTKNLVEKGAECCDTSKSMYKVRSELKYALKNYIVEYYFDPTTRGRGDWIMTSHDMQQYFGVKDFLVIAPQSVSGVVLDAPEASKLLSAVAIVLSNCSSLWPAFVPVHDPSRRAYIGIQSMGTIFTRRFEADRIASQVPIKLMHLEGLYELFVSKFAYSIVDLSTHLFKVQFKMKATYRTLPTDEEDEVEQSAEFQDSSNQAEFDTNKKVQWDYSCPWSEWYSAEDPVKGLELLTVWSERSIDSSLDMAELENASPLEAEKWFICPIFSLNLEFLDENTVGFASQLRLLVNALDSSLDAQYMEDFVSAAENTGSENVNSSAVIPPPTVLDRVLKDLFHDEAPLDFTEGENNNSKAIKAAPLESLFAQFCLHALWFGNCNIRAIAVLWIEFVREVRWCWEELQTLPRMPTSGTIDLSTCLVYQKLKMISLCIENLRQPNQEHQDGGEKSDCVSPPIKTEMQSSNSSSTDSSSPSVEMNDDFSAESDRKRSSDSSKSTINSREQNLPHSADPSSSDRVRRGSAGVVGSMMLLKSNQQMHAPLTQNLPLMTEDMHEERLQAVEALGDTFSFSAQLEKEILSSDMSAFKAANPDAVFEDFIRWHSPRDWEDDDSREVGVSQADTGNISNNVWPPRGKLSQRMSDYGNSWRKIWNDAPAIPVSEQKPHFEPKREGEKALHYLETLRPYLLLEQMVCTAFRASADTLNRTDYGGLKLMKSRTGQLNLTMASSLKFMQGRRRSSDSDLIEDLKRLCDIFAGIEQLLITAASLHLKFVRTPRLSEEIFNDFFKIYLPEMGTGSQNSKTDKVYTKKHPIMPRERDVIAAMFIPPTANQSWRKVLSMGNLLNGHEPVSREIIFSKRDHVSGSYYAGSDAGGYSQEIETYRMYICGTSNDISVALAVASCD